MSVRTGDASHDRGPLRRAATTTLALAAVTVVGATVYLTASGLATTGEALVWQGLNYLAWVPIAVAVAWAVARAERGGRAWLGMALAWPPATLLHGFVSAALTWWLRERAGRGIQATAPRPFAEAVPATVAGELPVEILQYWAIVAALTVVEARRRLRERERATARLEAELARARLAALRARLQPHFLFNTLQSIGLLIPRDPAAAQRMTVHLGDLLRASFARGDAGDARAEVPLGEELALARAYVAIEAERFRDRLAVRWEVDAAPADALVPDLLVQPLVENALRHGLWPRPGRGTLTVRAGVHDGGRGRTSERLTIGVEDDGAGPPADWTDDGRQDGVGLGATRARLDALYGSAASLAVAPRPGGGTRAVVTLPLRRSARLTSSTAPQNVPSTTPAAPAAASPSAAGADDAAGYAAANDRPVAAR